MEKIIIINSGSTSHKYALFEESSMIFYAHFEVAVEGYVLNTKMGDSFSKSEKISQQDFEHAFDVFIDRVLKVGLIKTEKEISAAAFRIVIPGTFFQEDKIIDEEYLFQIDDESEKSPLHVSMMRKEMNSVLDRLPKIKMIAISDTSFHKTIPEHARIYALPMAITKELDVYRFGYHGISISSVVEKIKNKFGKIPENVIVCHFGGGSSITAVKNGKSLDTTMGYTPVEGMPMATRTGNIDPVAIMAIMDVKDFDVDEMKNVLFNQSGMKGVSGISDDTRKLIEESEKGNKNAILALDHYAYCAKKYIGSFYSILGGVDLVVFTGTIGERAFKVRERILKGLGHLGIEVDENLNSKVSSGESFINKPGSKSSILVMETDEMVEMARRAFALK